MKVLCIALILALTAPCSFADRGAGSGGVGGYGGMTPIEREARRPDRYGAKKAEGEQKGAAEQQAAGEGKPSPAQPDDVRRAEK